MTLHESTQRSKLHQVAHILGICQVWWPQVLHYHCPPFWKRSIFSSPTPTSCDKRCFFNVFFTENPWVRVHFLGMLGVRVALTLEVCRHPLGKVQLRRHVDSPKITCGEEALAAWVSWFRISVFRRMRRLDTSRWRWGMSMEESHGKTCGIIQLKLYNGFSESYPLWVVRNMLGRYSKVLLCWISSQWIQHIFTWGGNRTQCWPFALGQRQVVFDVVDVDCRYRYKVATCLPALPGSSHGSSIFELRKIQHLCWSNCEN